MESVFRRMWIGSVKRSMVRERGNARFAANWEVTPLWSYFRLGCQRTPGTLKSRGTPQPSVLDERLGDSRRRFIVKVFSSPTEPPPLARHGPNPLASGGKDGVAHRRQGQRQRRLSQARRRVVGLAPIDLNLRRLLHASPGGYGSWTAGSCRPPA